MCLRFDKINLRLGEREVKWERIIVIQHMQAILLGPARHNEQPDEMTYRPRKHVRFEMSILCADVDEID